MTGGTGARALRVALREVFGVEGALDTIDFAGRTDRWILRQVFARFGLPDTEDNFQRYIEGYLAALPAELVKPGSRVLPGVESVLKAAAAQGFAQGLLTGNIRRGAELKLTHHGLWSYFAFGAFADDSEHRNELGPHAVRRAAQHAGVEFRPDRTWVIGDTPHDIECGRHIGARTIGVTTGRYSADELKAQEPDAVLPGLEDLDAFLRIVG